MTLTPQTLACWLGMSFCLSSAIAAGTASEAALSYTVTPRDTLIGLSRGLLVDPKAWSEVARLNRLRDPNRLTPGQTLQVPLRLLHSAQVPARVISVEGQVTVAGQQAKAGDTWRPGQALQTGENSSAVVALGDGSRIKLAPLGEAALDEHRRFDMKSKLSPADDTEGLFASTMRLVRGSIEVLATKVMRAKPLEVTTPTAVIGVRGTEYRVHHADAGSGAEVLEGQVRADVTGSSGTDLPAGFGAALHAGSAPEVAALATAPDLSGLPARFERPVVRFALPGEPRDVHVQVAADPAFDRLVRDERLPAGGEARIAGLADGTWHLRARRIDARGIEGYDSTRTLELKARPEPPAPMGPGAGAKLPVGGVDLRWAENIEAAGYRVQIARDAGFTDLAQQLDGVSGGQSHVELPQAGLYQWRLASVRASGDLGPWGDAQTFELRPLPEPPKGGLGADGASLELNWAGRPQDRQQVELARDAQFTAPFAQAELTEPHWELPTPSQPGSVFFRYRAVEPDGFVTPWSSTLKIEVPRDWRFLWLMLPLVFAL